MFQWTRRRNKISIELFQGNRQLMCLFLSLKPSYVSLRPRKEKIGSILCIKAWNIKQIKKNRNIQICTAYLATKWGLQVANHRIFKVVVLLSIKWIKFSSVASATVVTLLAAMFSFNELETPKNFLVNSQSPSQYLIKFD